MYFTVEQALAVYPLSEGKLIAGAGGLKRVIRSMNVMDAPDIADWMKEGEMLFTTAYLFKDSHEDAMELVRKLAKRRAAGLGIKLGRFWQSVPQPVIDLAERLDFPLIALPYAFTLSDQMNGLFQAEIKRTTNAMQEIMEKQVRLMRFALQAGSPASVFEAVSEVAGVKLAVVSPGGRVVCKPAELPENEVTAGWPWAPVKAKFRFAGSQALRVPMPGREAGSGFALFYHQGSFLTPLEEGLYVQAAELMAYHMNKLEEEPGRLPGLRDYSHMLRRFLKGEVDADALSDYALGLGIELLEKPYRCLLTDSGSDGSGKGKVEKLERVRLELESLPAMKELGAVHVTLDEAVLSVIPDNPEGADGALEQTLRKALGGSFKALPGVRSALSLRKLSGVEELTGAYAECADSLRVAREWGLADKMVAYGQLDLALVFERVPRERMRLYCDKWLGGLMAEKPDYAQEMLRTLEMYLDCDGQLNETAKRLFIHRNTVTYRIDKLSELLQVDFKSIGDLMRLRLAFLFRRLLESGSEEAGRAV